MRSHSYYTFAELEQTIEPAFDIVLVENISGRLREYARGYREGFAAGPELENALKNTSLIGVF